MKRWTYVFCIMLSLWLISSPPTMGYPSTALSISDIVSGLIILFSSIVALTFRIDFMRWIIASVGLWLTFAPLVFWAPDAGSYANDSIIGSFIILFSIIIPSVEEENIPDDTGLPEGWSYNPSTWEQRTPIIILAFLGYLMARYLSAFQLGHVESSWDPFFDKGTETILTSDVSKFFPVSDAGLGAWSYLLDGLFGAMGGTRRWRTMPWVVVLFGFMVIPPGVTSITLIILQPLAVGAWCTLCLVTAVIMLLMVPPAIDEVVATFQALSRAKKQNQSVWKMFWKGIPYEYSAPVPQKKERFSISWTLLVCTILGSWLMFSPDIFKATGLASNSNHLLGAIIVTFAIISMADVARMLRYINCILGLLLAAVIWFLPESTMTYKMNSMVVGVLLFVFSLPLGRITDHFGQFDRWVLWKPFAKRNLPSR